MKIDAIRKIRVKYDDDGLYKDINGQTYFRSHSNIDHYYICFPYNVKHPQIKKIGGNLYIHKKYIHIDE